MSRIERVGCVLVLFGFLLFSVGCGYVWKPLNECARQSDCPADQRCVQAVCKTTPGVGGSCTTNADCGAGACVAQTCQKLPAGGPCNANDDCQSGVCSNQKCEELNEPTKGDGGPGEKPIAPDDAGPDDRPIPEKKTPDDAGPDDEPTPELPPEGSPDVQHKSPQGPVNGCLTGATRTCLYKAVSTSRACVPGLQTCRFDGTWSDCGGGSGAPNSTGWYTPDERRGEFCGDNDDNNCNGKADEGCYDTFNDRCQDIQRVEHSATQDGGLLHPAILRGDSYSPTRKVLLRKSLKTNGVLSLYAITAGQKARWLMDLPSVSKSIYSYDLSIDGDRVAVSTSEQIIVWLLKYNKDGIPSVSHFGIFPVKHVLRLGFRGNVSELVAYQNYQDNKLSIHQFSTWKLTQNASGQLVLSLIRRIYSPINRSDSFAFYGDHRLGVHPDGSYVVFYSYAHALIYQLPQLTLIKHLELGSPPDPESRRIAFHSKRPLFVIGPVNYGQYALSVDMSVGADGKPKATMHKMYEWPSGDVQGLGFEPTTGELYAYKYGLGLIKWPDLNVTQSAKARSALSTGRAFAMSADSKLLFVGGSAGELRIVSTDDGKELYRWRTQELKSYNDEYIRHMTLLPDDKTLFVISSKALDFWEISESNGVYTATGKQTIAFAYSARNTYQTAFSRDGTWMAISTNDVIQVWKLDSNGMFVKHSSLNAHKGKVKSMAFHPTKSMLLSSDDKGQLRLWDLDDTKTARLIHTFMRNAQSGQIVYGTAFHEVSQKDNDTYILATTEDSVTHAFSLTVTAQGDIRTAKLAGTLVSTVKSTPSQVEYQSNGFVLIRHGSSSKNALVKLGFAFSAADAQGNRTFAQDGTQATLALPDGSGYSTAVFSRLSGRYLHLATSSHLYLWRCKR